MDGGKSRRPLDTPFRQQTLKAWRPILTPRVVILTFFLVGCVFIPIGCFIMAESEKVIEAETGDYSALCCEDNCDATDGTRVDKNPCTITLDVPEDMSPPIYMYYKLTDFYQNHRRYVKSRSDAQLRGVENLKPSVIKAECTDVHVRGDPDGADNVSNVVSPCGLISWSLFNDSFALSEKAGAAVAISSQGIAWESDTKYKFRNSPEGTTGQFFPPFAYERQAGCGELSDDPDPELQKLCEAYRAACSTAECRQAGLCFPHSGRCVEDEHFMVWMRTAGLPTFRKLYAKIDTQLTKGSYEIEVSNGRLHIQEDGTSTRWNHGTDTAQRGLFPVHGFGGQKSVVLSTMSFMGGKNSFLGVAYIVVGALCLALALLFFIKDHLSPRKLGDPSYITFNKKQADK
jgi:hypothetical protein